LVFTNVDVVVVLDGNCNELATDFRRRARAGRESGDKNQSWLVDREAQDRGQSGLLLTVVVVAFAPMQEQALE